MSQDEHLSNAIALSEETIHLILQDFERYRELIAQAVVKYLVDGGDDGILQQLQGYNTQTLNQYNSFDRYRAPCSSDLAFSGINSGVAETLEGLPNHTVV